MPQYLIVKNGQVIDGANSLEAAKAIQAKINGSEIEENI